MRYDSISGVGNYNKDPEALTLGSLIDKLFQCDRSKHVYFIGTVTPPSTVSSYAGNWMELAINYELIEPKEITVQNLHSFLLDSTGKWFKGYKGGEHLSNSDCKVWAGRTISDKSDLAIVGVHEDKHAVYLVTLKK